MNTTRILITTLTVILTSASAALAATVNFDVPALILNQSVNGQGGWTVQDSFGNSGGLFDEKVVDVGGNRVWRISNAVTATSYSNQPFSQTAPVVAGETGAGLYNNYGNNHLSPNSPPLSSATAASPYFYGAWDFKSATGAAQSGISMAISPSAKQSTLRESFVQIVDPGAGGFNVNFFDTTGTGFNFTSLATGLSYSDWHTLEMFIEFVDGIGPGAAGFEAGNDIVRILIDGALVHTGTTWESFFYNVNDAGIPAPSARAVDSLLFRQSGTAVPGNAGGGLYFDNIIVSNAIFAAAIQTPEPSTFALAAIGLMGIARRRRRMMA